MDITSVRSRRFSVTRRNLLAGRFARIPDGEWTRQLAGQLALNADDARGPATCSSTMRPDRYPAAFSTWTRSPKFGRPGRVDEAVAAEPVRSMVMGCINRN
jgi:hypothetical protein